MLSDFMLETVEQRVATRPLEAVSAVTVNALLIEIRRLKQKEQALRGVLQDNRSRLVEAGQHYPWSSPSTAAHSCIDARALHGVVRQMSAILNEEDV